MSGSEPRTPWYANPPAPVGCLILLLLGILSIPYAFVFMIFQSISEKRFRRRMKKHGRYIEWACLLPALTAGEGTLIIEQGHKQAVRCWWTSDDVLSLAPFPPPGEHELDTTGVARDNPHEFVAWCYRRYTDEDAGSAILTLPSLELPPGLFFAKFFEERFPRISAIDTVYCLRAEKGIGTD